MIHWVLFCVVHKVSTRSKIFANFDLIHLVEPEGYTSGTFYYVRCLAVGFGVVISRGVLSNLKLGKLLKAKFPMLV